VTATASTTTSTDAPRTFADAEAFLAASLPGYQARPHQQALAAEIEQAIDAKTILVAEAGTGTGKSLAALIPAILWAKANGKRVVVATATKALQTQYARKDLPFLQAHLGVPFRWAVIKGRSNYPCQSKINDLAKGEGGYADQVQREVMALVEEITARGDLDFIDRDDLPATADREWNMLSMKASECPGKDGCPFAETSCHAQRAKKVAARADIVITNMAYLAVDIKLSRETGGLISLLGDYDLLIIDEAHNLDSAITGALTSRIGEGTYRKLAGDAGSWLRGVGLGTAEGDNLIVQASALWGVLSGEYDGWQAKRRANKMRDEGNMPVTEQLRLAVFGPAMQKLFAALRELGKALRSVHDFDDAYAPGNVDPYARKMLRAQQRLIRRVTTAMDQLKAFATEEDEVSVRWVEQDEDGRSALFLRATPVSPAPFLAENVWSVTPAVLMSATLAPARDAFGNADFSYTIDSLGLDEFDHSTYESGTPFDYPTQAMLYVPERTVPVPSGKDIPAWRAYTQEVTRGLVTASGGGALLLFTSRSGMNEAHKAMAESFEYAGLEVLKQGDAPTPELIRRFKEDGNAVLFALRTFFEGIDIPGDALRLVLLDKLPFPVPSDLLFAARCAKINRKYGQDVSFRRLSMPMMTLPLVQAAGRLLRTVTDRGVIAILDSRLTSKPYGKQILNSLPPARQTTDPHDAVAFLEGMR
jgi:ATP-dependent DNA helicase DinG